MVAVVAAVAAVGAVSVDLCMHYVHKHMHATCMCV